MDKTEAIKILEALKAVIEWEFSLDCQIALDMAIEALEKEMRNEQK